MTKKKIKGVEDYKGAAAGWAALKAVADALRGQMAVVNETHGLLTMNQPVIVGNSIRLASEVESGDALG